MDRSFAKKNYASNYGAQAARSVGRTILLMIFIVTQTHFVWCAELGGRREGVMATISPPTTTTDVLRNFKFALDNDLFLREDFYTEDSLKRFFAADKITWDEATPTRKSGYVDTQYSVLFFLVRGTIDEKWNVVPNGKKLASGTINTNASADMIVELFGPPKEIRDPYDPHNLSHPTPLMKKTHKFGNLAIEYKFDHSRSSASLTCIFNGNGSVKGCSFGNAEK
jgi:hypothetical protein